MSSHLQDRSPTVGRFAPSPTGPLHFGSLVAALGSYLSAKKNRGRWLVRIEDLDPPRVVPGAAAALLRLLEALAFEWDGEVIYQSRRFERYRQVLQQLSEQGLTFPCSCSRREIIASAPQPGEDGPIYPGTCRRGPVGQRRERAIRLRVPDEELLCQDQIFGPLRQNLRRDVGDFVLRRTDGLYAYQLAVVIDDIDSGVNQVVRGADLFSSTPRQVFLYRCLQQPLPDYFHLPLVLGVDAKKLSKRYGPSALITVQNGRQALWWALEFLGQQPPQELAGAAAAELLSWGIEHFSPDLVQTAGQPAPVLSN
ncbi:MAG: tRNA glutamyl-Q(34) synthetase GluQRS [Deltaproteobacteria bacterium]|nr:tRNA glutamyl-Q(34) synthetase GluQRS [Deltaproteobacteria bacterium]